MFRRLKNKLAGAFNTSAVHPLIGNFINWPIAPPQAGERRVTLVLGSTNKSGLAARTAGNAAGAGLTGKTIFFLGGVPVFKDALAAANDDLTIGLDEHPTERIPRPLPHPVLNGADDEYAYETESEYMLRIFSGDLPGRHELKPFDFHCITEKYSANTQQNFEQAAAHGAFDGLTSADSILAISHPSHISRAMATLSRVLMRLTGKPPKEQPALLPLMSGMTELAITPETAHQHPLIAKGLTAEWAKTRDGASPEKATYVRAGFMLPLFLQEDPPPPSGTIAFSVPHARRRAERHCRR